MLEVVQPTSPFHFSKTACIKNDQHQFRFYKISEIKQPSVEENRVEEGERGAEQSSRRTEHRGGREEQSRERRGEEEKTYLLLELPEMGVGAAGNRGWSCWRCSRCRWGMELQAVWRRILNATAAVSSADVISTPQDTTAMPQAISVAWVDTTEPRGATTLKRRHNDEIATYSKLWT